MRKLRLKGLTLALAFCLLCNGIASASTFRLVSDIAHVDGFAPVFMQGGFVVPVDLAAAFGAEVRAEGDRYTITYLGTATTVRPGDERAFTPVGERTLQPRPFVAADTLFVPLSFLADVLRLRVSWNPTTNDITLTRWVSPLLSLISPPQGDSGASLGQFFPLGPPVSSPAQVAAQVSTQVAAQISNQLSNQISVQVGTQASNQAGGEIPAEAGGESAAQNPGESPADPAGAAAIQHPAGAAPLTAEAAVQLPGVPRPLARLEAPLGPVAAGAPSAPEQAEESGAPIVEEPGATGAIAPWGIWPSFFAATGVSLERSVEGGVAVYAFGADGELEVTTAVLVDPFRLVVDLKGVKAKPGSAFEPLPVGEGGVRRIRASPLDDGVRVVFDMDLALGHKVVRLDGGRVGVRLFRPFLGIEVAPEGYGGRLTIDVPAETPYVVSRLVQPDRIVIDLFDATLVQGPVSLELDGGPLTRVRAAQFLPDVARVVLDVSEPVEIEPAGEAGGLVFLYGDAVAPISYRRAAAGIDLKIHAGEGAEVRVSRLSGPDRLVIDVTPMMLDAPLEDVMIPGGPVYRLRASQYTADTVRIVADLKYYVQYAVHRDGRRTIVALRQPSLAGRTITVDAGHGGIDVGAISTRYGLTEKEVNLDISLRLRDLITGAEGSVLLTRSDDSGIGNNQRDSLMERVRFASDSDSEVFVSVHNNSALVPGPTARGTETFYRSDDPKSKALAESVQASVVSALGTVDRGIIDNRTRGYFVLRYIDKPAILVEVAFLSHPEEEELLMHDWFRQRAAEGIFNGLLKYFHPGDLLDDSSLLLTGTEAWLRMKTREQQP